MTSATATFTHPDWLRPNVEQVPGVVVHEDEQRRLFMALRRHAFPVPYWQSCITPLVSSGAPSGAAAAGPERLRAQLQALQSPVFLRNVPLQGPNWAAVQQATSKIAIIKQWERAMLPTTGTFDAWMMQNFDHKRRKELKRLRARLAEQGDLRVDRLQPGGELSPFVEGLLALEAMGWKGRRGTALRCQPRVVKALHESLQSMHRHGRVRFWLMSLSGKPIAALFALVDRDEATLGKIAYDESLGRFSPGVQIILEATEDFFAEPEVEWADSNAIPDHPMINRIWRGRLPCGDVLLAPEGTGPANLAVLRSYLGTKDAVRSVIKHVVRRAIGGKHS